MSRSRADSTDMYLRENALAEGLAYMLTEPVTTPARTIGVIVPTKVVWDIICDKLVAKVGRDRFTEIRKTHLRTADGFLVEGLSFSRSAGAFRGRTYDKMVYFEYDYPRAFLEVVRHCEVPPNA